MTNAQERAKTARKLALLLIGESGAKVELIISATLAQVEAETWEQATKIAMMGACDRCFHESCDVQRTMAKNCHQQAQRAKVEDGTK